MNWIHMTSYLFYQQAQVIAWSGAPAQLHPPTSQMVMSSLPRRKTTSKKETVQKKKNKNNLKSKIS
ncbi:hypothetical protein L208DRAFT_509770 [Tricholoma matsutake]|nr:hypothetical protein L208DRAFT_509770 [Tricholoma matsutake 945]